MRAAWASFAATGNPSTGDVQWLPFAGAERVESLVTPRPVIENDFESSHHCTFWAAN